MAVLDEFVIRLALEEREFARGVSAATRSADTFARTAERSFGEVERSARSSLGATSTQLVRTARSAEAAGRSLLRFSNETRAGIQVAAFQIQDIITQIGLGVPVTRALSIQLPQLFGAFSAGGAVLGTVVGLALMFSERLFGIGQAANDAQKRIDELSRSFAEYVDKVIEAAAKSRDFEGEIEKLGRNAIELRIGQITDEIKALKEELGTVTAEPLAKFADFVAFIEAQFEHLRERVGRAASDLPSAAAEAARRSLEELDRLRISLVTLQRLVQTGAIGFGELQARLRDLAEAFDNELLAEFASEFTKSGSAAEALQKQIADLEKQLERLRQAADNAKAGLSGLAVEDLERSIGNVRDFTRAIDQLAERAVEAAKKTGDFGLALRALDESTRALAIANKTAEIEDFGRRLQELGTGAVAELETTARSIAAALGDSVAGTLQAIAGQIRGGTLGITQAFARVSELARQFPDSPQLAQLVERFRVAATAARSFELQIEESRAAVEILERGAQPAATAVDRLTAEISRSEEAARRAEEQTKRLQRAHIDYLKSVGAPRPRPFSQGVPIPVPRPFNLRSDRGMTEAARRLASEQISVLREVDSWWQRIADTANNALADMLTGARNVREAFLDTFRAIHRQLIETFFTQPITQGIINAVRGSIGGPMVFQAPGIVGMPFGGLLPQSFLNFPLLTTSLPQGAAHAAGVAAVPGGLLNAPTTIPAFTVGNALTAGLLGFTGGSFIGSFFGEPMRGGIGGGLGALAGAALGSVVPGIGTALGGLLGGGLGSIIGALSGGGQSKNAANIRIEFPTGRTISEDKSPGPGDPNRQAARLLAEEVRQFAKQMRLLGVELRPFEVPITVSRTQTPEEEEADIIRGLKQNLRVDDSLIRQIIERTTATTFEELSADIGLAEAIREFETGQRSADRFVAELADLRSTFEDLRTRAQTLGLSLETLDEIERKAVDELLRTAEDAVIQQRQQVEQFFAARISPLEQLIQSMQFGNVSLLSPAAQFEEAQRLFREAVAQARAGDQAAFAQVPQLGQLLIQQARDFGASGLPFREVFREVNQVLSEFISREKSLQENVLATLPEDLRAAQRDVVEELKKQTEQLVRELQELRREVERQRRRAA